MNFAFEPFHLVAAEIADKLDRIAAEMNEEYERPNVDWGYYLAASELGTCFAVTLRENGNLIGCSVWTIGENANHKHILEAQNVLVSVDKDRRGRGSYDLFRESERLLKSAGVKRITYLLKDRRIGKLLSRQGYLPDYVEWSKGI